MLERVGDPALAALLLSKTAIADERGIELRLAGDSVVAELRLPAQDVLTVVGNLLDNALDAVAAQPGGRVELTLRIGQRGGLCVIVRDNGPGVQAEPIDRVFSPGWTTKPSQHPGGRGLGLALARHAISRLGGTISARNDGGAVFEAYLPDVPASAREVVRA
jgi:two-component system CitB family sensor kinase